MKLPKSLIAGVGILMVGVTPLLQAAPGPDDQNQGRGGDQHMQQGGPGGQNGGGHNDNRGQGNNGNNGNNGGGHQANRGGGRPPQDFGPVRQMIQQNRDSFARGNPPPPNIRLERGRPLPRGYGRPLDARALQHMPRYDGYQWRRVGSDVVLVAVGSGLVYEILDNVLN